MHLHTSLSDWNNFSVTYLPLPTIHDFICAFSLKQLFSSEKYNQFFSDAFDFFQNIKNCSPLYPKISNVPQKFRIRKIQVLPHSSDFATTSKMFSPLVSSLINSNNFMFTKITKYSDAFFYESPSHPIPMILIPYTRPEDKSARIFATFIRRLFLRLYLHRSALSPRARTERLQECLPFARLSNARTIMRYNCFASWNLLLFIKKRVFFLKVFFFVASVEKC